MYILGSKSRHLQRIVQFRRSSFTARRGKGVVLLPQLENSSQIPEQTPTFACQTTRGDRAAYSEPSLGFTLFFTAVAQFWRIFWGSDCPLAASFPSRCMAAQGSTVHFAAEDEAWTKMLHSTSYGCTFVIFCGDNIHGVQFYTYTNGTQPTMY